MFEANGINQMHQPEVSNGYLLKNQKCALTGREYGSAVMECQA
jgi:hypothetical protein